MPDLLLELFSEEIPARMQARAAEDLKRLVTDKLVEAGLTYSSAGAFVTPRRLALTLTDLPEMTPAIREERKGPRADAPEKAIEGFLRSTGLTREDLETRDDKKGQILFAIIDKPGRPAADVIAEAVTDTVRTFPWPKSMRWGAGNLRWVRPLHRDPLHTRGRGRGTRRPLRDRRDRGRADDKRAPVPRARDIRRHLV